MSVGEERKEREKGLRKNAKLAREFLEITQKIAMAVDEDNWEEVHVLLTRRQRLMEEMEGGEVDMEEAEAYRNVLVRAAELDGHVIGNVIRLQQEVGDELKTLRRLRRSLHAYGNRGINDSRFTDVTR